MRKDDCRAYPFSPCLSFYRGDFLPGTGRFFAQDAPTSPNPQGPANSAHSVKVDVDLVPVNATVTDPSNRFVTVWKKIISKFLKTR